MSLLLLASPAHALGPTLNSVAPDTTLYSVNAHQDQSLHEFLGDQIGLIFVWLGGCPSCAPGAAVMGDLMAKFVDRGVRGLMVTLQGDREVSEITLMALQPPYTIASDDRGEFKRRYNVETFPTVLIVDRQKRIRYIGQQVEFYTAPEVAVARVKRALEDVLKAPQ